MGGHSAHWSVKAAKRLAIHLCQEWKRKQVSTAAPHSRVKPGAMETDPGKLISNLTWSQRKTLGFPRRQTSNCSTDTTRARETPRVKSPAYCGFMDNYEAYKKTSPQEKDPTGTSKGAIRTPRPGDKRVTRKSYALKSVQ